MPYDKRSIPMYVAALFEDGDVYLNFEGNEGDIWVEKVSTLVGIPLTEELLEKCGFKKYWYSIHDLDTYDYIKDVFTFSFSSLNGKITGNIGHFDSEGAFMFDIKYLHELQNAYYVLTKKSLNIKL